MTRFCITRDLLSQHQYQERFYMVTHLYHCYFSLSAIVHITGVLLAKYSSVFSWVTSVRMSVCGMTPTTVPFRGRFWTCLKQFCEEIWTWKYNCRNVCWIYHILLICGADCTNKQTTKVDYSTFEAKEWYRFVNFQCYIKNQ